MKAEFIVCGFGSPASAECIDGILEELGTYQRPELPDGRQAFYDWILVRRQGVELGFVDSEYQAATARWQWGRGHLLLSQAYFYSGVDDIRAFADELPFELTFEDSREIARAKLAEFEATRHSYRDDTWDVEGYRLSVMYAKAGSAIDRIACRMLASPIPRKTQVQFPDLIRVADTFGYEARSPEFRALWPHSLTDDDFRAIRDDGELDLTQSYGATLGFVDSSSGPIFRAITLHRNRDQESVGWHGALPLGLDFEDSPETLFGKISRQPIQQANSVLTGHAVWHFDNYTLHVLYSNLDNRLLRVKLLSPGTWKCVEDEDLA
ncbi:MULTISPECIES: hypothetical protein [unclassified Paraburkholderia]|uniref:hypothetical protein n=1 Tax=unclassified Paraburkholderia TaxID=2615204 RepID=UPI002AB19FD1|nr:MULTISPECIES: hypothetical protein [unclassified Paraburkholderia]